MDFVEKEFAVIQALGRVPVEKRSEQFPERR